MNKSKSMRAGVCVVLCVLIIASVGTYGMPRAEAAQKADSTKTPWIVTAWNATGWFFGNLFTSVYNGFVGVFGSINDLFGKVLGVHLDTIGKSIGNFFWNIPGDIADLAKKFWSILPFSKLKK